jgi:hypothetical protein
MVLVRASRVGRTFLPGDALSLTTQAGTTATGFQCFITAVLDHGDCWSAVSANAVISFALPREPIPLSQRLRLLCAAKRVERAGGDADRQGWPLEPSTRLQRGEEKARRAARRDQILRGGGSVVGLPPQGWHRTIDAAKRN